MDLRLGRYFWKLFLANAVVMVLVLAGCVWVIISQLDRFREEELSRHLLAQASALEVAVRDRFDPMHAAELNALAEQVGSTELEGVRVTFVLAHSTLAVPCLPHNPLYLGCSPAPCCPWYQPPIALRIRSLVTELISAFTNEMNCPSAIA